MTQSEAHLGPVASLGWARDAGDYLVRMQGDSGVWRYVFDPYHPEPKSAGYNILRHAGTAWALFRLGRVLGERRYLEAGSRAVGFLVRHCRIDGERAYVLDTGTEKAKLGALGLTLLAMAERADLDPGPDDAELMQYLARQILDLQRPNGRFESYVRQDGQPSSDWSSLYYPGEAMLGLTRYAATLDPLEAAPYLGACVEGVRYLLRAQTEAVESGQTRILPPDAWLVQAIEAVVDHVQGDDEVAYVEHALRLAEGILHGQYGIYGPPALVGGFPPLPAPSCRSAARAEGLLAALRLGRRKAAFDPRLAGIVRGLKLACAHVEAHRYWAREVELSRAHGGIAMSAKDPSIRIDTVQHAISMWLGLAALDVARVSP